MATLPHQLPTQNRPQSTLPPQLPKASVRPYLIGPAVCRAASTAKSSFVSLPHETEDTRITGGTRSLDRRLLALNLEGTLSARKMSGRSMPASTSDSKIA
ncbi:MAG: hypothetical protein NVSMB3_01270 [Acidobacteriaceae bacterium]